MGRHKDVIELPEGMLGRASVVAFVLGGRVCIPDIQRSSRDGLAGEEFVEVCLVDDVSPGDVDEERGGFHLAELFLGDALDGVVGERDADDHEVGVGKEVLSLLPSSIPGQSLVPGEPLLVPADGHYIHPKGLPELVDPGSDGPVTDDPEGLSFQGDGVGTGEAL